MPKQIARYLCHICGTEHNTFDEALQCEALPTEPQHCKEGDVISFEDESTLFGTRYSYTWITGTVLLAYPFLNKGGNGAIVHRWAYVVRANDAVHCECIVYESEHDGMTKLFSPAEYKYKPGYAEMVRQQLLEARN